MNKIFGLLFSLFFLLAACGDSDQPSSSPSKQTDKTQDPHYAKGLALVAQSDCLTCHQIQEKRIGPSYVEIAKKYSGADDAMVSELAQRIIKGGSGVWGEIPMTAHPTLSQQDAEGMVQYILLLN